MPASPNRDGPRVNEDIRVPQVRLIDQDGEMLGVMTAREAIQRAYSVGLDLLEISPNADPPVCKILDFGKFKYQQKKRLTKGHTHHGKNKEIRLRPKIGDHDFMTKVNHARQFLKARDKVICSVIFRGRENAHVEEGFKLVKRLVTELEQDAKVEQAASMQGRRIVLILAPK